MSSRKSRMRAKANALFEHNKNYTFRQLMEIYRFWKRYIKRRKKRKVITCTWSYIQDKIDDFESYYEKA